MNHSDAIQMGACEKYLLGELTAQLRDEFEQHYFECSECAHDVQAAALFLSATREALKESAVPVRSHERATRESSWFRWLRPAIAVPAFAVLLLFLGYQNLVTLPHWKNLASQAASSDLLKPILLHPGMSRGTEPRIPVAPGQSFAVYLDIPTQPAYSAYLIRLQRDSSAATRDLLTLSPSEIQKAPLLKMPSDLVPGSAYTIHVLGLPQAGAPSSSASEVAQFSFLIEIPANIEQH
jgi:hypothetical protein